MQQLRHPAPVCRASGHETGGGVAVRGAGAEPAGTRDSQSTALYWSFPGTALDVSLSRRWLAAAAQALWGAGDDADRLVLAYSEVATNAAVHGLGPVTVCARIHPGGATCEVADRSARPPQPRHAAPDDDSGRGLDLVAHTVDRLRVTTDEDGKTVRFEIGRTDAGSGRSPVPESADSPLPGPPRPVPVPPPGRHHHPGQLRSSVGGSADGSADGNPLRARPGPMTAGAHALGESGG
ncbi:MAG: ATP-binding protein [Catenulispora sp.]|nr:ATP-binding protein [Catenulispora sp.]